MANFVNVEKFWEWLDGVLKEEFLCYNRQNYLDDIIKTWEEKCSGYYEIPSHHTKSRKPECISFDVEEEECDGEYHLTITF